MVRVRHRYLTLEFIFRDGQVDQQITGKIINEAVSKAIEGAFGSLGLGAAKPRLFVIYWNSITNIAVLRVLREHVRFVLASITLNLKHIRNRHLVPRCVHVSGTIRCAKQAILELARNNLIDVRIVEDLSKLHDDEDQI